MKLKLNEKMTVNTNLLLNILLLYLYMMVINSSEVKNLHQVNHEQNLINKILVPYNNKLRPTGRVQVKFAFNINQIIDIVEKDQIMVINAFVDHKWTDPRLSWGKDI